MPGMGGGPVASGSSLVVQNFQSALLHQSLVVLVILSLLAISWNILRARQIHESAEAAIRVGVVAPLARLSEAPGRRLLRIGFGLLWIFDGLLQMQSSMPAGLADQVISPAASSSPRFVHQLVHVGVDIWNSHPVTAAVAVVWIQVGIGLWLVVAPSGRWLRAGALVSVGWALLIWAFGEAFGGLFGPGTSFLFGSPGAVVFYAMAGIYLAQGDRAWTTARLGRSIFVVMGLDFLGFGVLQAWPGRGFWQGRIGADPHGGTLAAMVTDMSQTPQPGFLSAWVRSFASYVSAHGFAVNVFVVFSLVMLGLTFLAGSRRMLRAAVVASTVFCVAVWILVQDLGFLGGVGTDPNSMVPIMVLIVAGYVAISSRPDPFDEIEALDAGNDLLRVVDHRGPAYTFRALGAAGALGIVLLGSVPIAVVSFNTQADAIVTEAENGLPNATHVVAPTFSLADQTGRTVSLASLRGKAVALTFLDPVCTTDCPLIAQEFRRADLELGADASRVELVSIVSNPIYRSRADVVAFDHQEGLDTLSNWHFLTGSRAALDAAWQRYGIEVDVVKAGGMINHSDLTYIIDPTGHERFILNSDPGAGTSVTESSFAGLLVGELRQVIGR